VFQAIAASNGFTCGGDGATGFLAVGTIGEELGFGSHVDLLKGGKDAIRSLANRPASGQGVLDGGKCWHLPFYLGVL